MFQEAAGHAATRAKGIPVCNVPDYCIDEVADQTLAFILGTTRQVVTNSITVRSGQWRLAVPLAAMHPLTTLDSVSGSPDFFRRHHFTGVIDFQDHRANFHFRRHRDTLTAYSGNASSGLSTPRPPRFRTWV